MDLVATFPKTANGRNLATYAWSDGLVATTPSNGSPRRLPHDLEHYILESQVDNETPSRFEAMTPDDLVALVPFHGRLHADWDRVPVGGALRVAWPRRSEPVVIHGEAAALTA